MYWYIRVVLITYLSITIFTDPVVIDTSLISQ